MARTARPSSRSASFARDRQCPAGGQPGGSLRSCALLNLAGAGVREWTSRERGWQNGPRGRDMAAALDDALLFGRRGRSSDPRGVLPKNRLMQASASRMHGEAAGKPIRPLRAGLRRRRYNAAVYLKRSAPQVHVNFLTATGESTLSRSCASTSPPRRCEDALASSPKDREIGST